MQVRFHLVKSCAVVRPEAAVHGGADDLVHGIVDGRFGVLAEEHVGEPSRTADVLGDRRVSQAEVVEGHVALAHVVPLGVAGMGDAEVLVVDVVLQPHRGRAMVVVEVVDAVPVAVVEQPRRRVPVLERQVYETLVSSHVVEEAPVVRPLVVVVEVVRPVPRAASLGVLAAHHVRALLHEGDELQFEQRPRRGSRNLAGGDCRHIRDVSHGVPRVLRETAPFMARRLAMMGWLLVEGDGDALSVPWEGVARLVHVAVHSGVEPNCR